MQRGSPSDLRMNVCTVFKQQADNRRCVEQQGAVERRPLGKPWLIDLFGVLLEHSAYPVFASKARGIQKIIMHGPSVLYATLRSTNAAV